MDTAFNVLICVLVSTTLIFKYTLLPVWNDTDLSLFSRLINMIYPIFDLAFLSGLLSLWFYNIHAQKLYLVSIGYIILSFSLQFTADELYFSRIAPIPPAAFWTRSGLFLPAASYSLLWHLISQPPEKPLLPATARKLSLLLPYLLTISLVFTINLQHFDEDPLIAGITITLLVIIPRQFFVQQRNTHSCVC